MKGAPPGKYSFDAEIESLTSFPKRITQIFSVHVSAQSFPCFFLFMGNSVLLRRITPFGYVKLLTSLVNVLYGLYFMIANGILNFENHFPFQKRHFLYKILGTHINKQISICVFYKFSSFLLKNECKSVL
jgi:hypothetical protein